MANISKIELNGTTYEVEDTTARTDIGNVDSLKTTAKDNLVEAVNECFQSASDGKALIASAITGKGVTTSSGATFATMATNIAAIKTNPTLQSKTAVLSTSSQTISADSGYDGLSKVTVPAVVGTATTSNVLKEKTFSSASGVSLTGTMADNGAVNQTLNAGGSYTIPVGYHNGSGKVTVNSLASQTSATADASSIVSGKTAWVNGAQITGNIANIGTYSSGCSSAVLYQDRVYLRIPGGYYYGGSYDTNGGAAEVYIPYADLASLLGITASKILTGNTICGVSGTAPNIQFASGTATTYGLTSSLGMQVYFGSNAGGTTTTSFGAIDITTGFVPNLVVIKNLGATGESVNRKGMAIYSTLFNPFPGYDGILTMGYYGDSGVICISTTNQNSSSPFYWGTTCRFAVSQYIHTGESAQWYAFRI